MRVTAKLNYLHISPRKVRAVVNVVKKMNPRDALNQLRFIPNLASRPLSKLINSAIANAENNFSLEAGSLKILEFKVDGGSVFKRFRPGSRGRVSPLGRKTSHITLILEGQRLRGDSKKKAISEKIEPQPGPAEMKNIPEAEKIISEKIQDNKPREDRKGLALKPKPHQRGSGFVKRMFQRKAV